MKSASMSCARVHSRLAARFIHWFVRRVAPVLGILGLSMAMAAASPLLSSVKPRQGVHVSPAQVKLIPAGRDPATGHYRAVAEIALAAGYKTYWREPGDSGVPTTFDWSASENVADARVRYPAPVRFFDGIGYAIGYLGTVRFPLEIVPLAGDRPADLRLTIDFGICKDICIPEQATVSASLSDVEQVAGLWDEAVRLLPVPASLGATVDGVGIAQVQLEGDTLLVTASGDIREGADVFAEGPPGWQFGRLVRAPEKGEGVFAAPVRHPVFDAPVDVVVTLVTDARTVETRARLSPGQ